MPERVTVREDLQLIQVESYGEVTSEDLMGSLDAVVKIRQERNLTRVFVDATKETSLPGTFSAFEFGTQMAESARGLRVAVVGSKMLAHDLRFIETAARNRGSIIQVFDKPEDALAWLAEGASNSMEPQPDGAPH